MGLLAALFSAASRKLGTLLQAVFGWSVMAMFGKLSSRKQSLINVALVLSLFWPVFVVGVFAPKVVAFIVAFVPGEVKLNPDVLRMVWVSLAVLAPVVVGLLTRIASPPLKRRGLVMAMLLGYPLTLGYALSFLVTLCVVPVVKLQTLARRWDDEHVFVQTRKGHYLDAIEQLCDAATLAGLEPSVHPAPRAMGLATRLLKFFARGSIDQLVAEHPLVVRARNMEMLLFPGDLLLRGKKIEVARLRATLGQTRLEKHAYLVEQPHAQELQDDLGRLWETVDRHADPTQLGASAKSALKDVVYESSEAQLSFDEWMVLDRIARRIEQRMSGQPSLVDQASVDEDAKLPGTEPEGLRAEVAAAKAVAPLNDASMLELVERGLHDAANLARLEVAHAKAEAEEQAKEAAKGLVGFALAAAFAVVTLALGGVALVFVLGASAKTALVVAGGALVLALIVAAVGYSLLPKALLSRTRKHVKTDLAQLKEHLA
ncbi:MAG: phage holin family protein [Archangiaceae bacterium]|nr:phage holin family protein [Archangiaceae bacterium]